MTNFADKYLKVNGVNIHYRDNQAEGKPKLVLLHGLTANAHAFDGVLSSGLNEQYHLLIPDLRGRGLSDQPAFCYTMNEHAEDIIGLMDIFGIRRANLVGHSFGGLLSFYLAANYADRVDRIVALDAAAEMNSKAPEMLSFSLLRLDKVFPSFDEFLAILKKAPFASFWDEYMTAYYAADVKELPDGQVTPRSNLVSIIEVAKNVGNEPWKVYINHIEQPVLLLNALGNYSLDEPLLPESKARETIDKLQNGTYGIVSGNHHTMLYGKGASEIAAAIAQFIPAPTLQVG
jgi:pimeloyl-ACP methyl ester carboxylesterase